MTHLSTQLIYASSMFSSPVQRDTPEYADCLYLVCVQFTCPTWHTWVHNLSVLAGMRISSCGWACHLQNSTSEFSAISVVLLTGARLRTLSVHTKTGNVGFLAHRLEFMESWLFTRATLC